MNLPYLITEMLFDLAAVVMGVSIILKRTDNFPKFYWGCISIIIGLTLFGENIGWIILKEQNPEFIYTDILNIDKMLKWYILASIVSIYPMASLKPGSMCILKLLICLLPAIIVSTVGISYYLFNGNITYIDSVDEILVNIDKLDIKLRLSIFFMTLLTPLSFFIIPILRIKGKRKINSKMHLLITSILALVVIYILFTLFLNDFIFNLYGGMNVLFAIYFSYQYIMFENPFTVRSYKCDNISDDNTEDNHISEISKTEDILPLFYEIENVLKDSRIYSDSKFTIEKLSEITKVRDESLLSTAIKSAGYSGFRDYINNLRLENFKYEAGLDSNRTIKELMYVCGFTSKTTFYRIYSDKYGMTPKEYIDKLSSEKENITTD